MNLTIIQFYYTNTNVKRIYIIYIFKKLNTKNVKFDKLIL